MIADYFWHQGNGDSLNTKLILLNEYILQLNSLYDVTKILYNSAEKVADMLETPGCHILLSRKVRRQLKLETAYHYNRHNIAFPQDADETKGISGLTFSSGQPVLVNDATNDPRVTRKIVDVMRAGSVLSVPIICKEMVIGVVTVYHEEKYAFKQGFCGNITVCYGLATYLGINGSANKFIERADQGLYKMKIESKKKEA